MILYLFSSLTSNLQIVRDLGGGGGGGGEAIVNAYAYIQWQGTTLYLNYISKCFAKNIFSCSFLLPFVQTLLLKIYLT